MDRAELQLNDDERFSRREFLVGRIGRILMAAVIVAAALGLFANGPLSRRTAAAGQLTVHFQRFSRNQGQTTLEIETDGSTADQGEVTVEISRSLLEVYDVDHVFPEPESTKAAFDAVQYVFQVTDRDAQLDVSLYLHPERVGRQQGGVSVGEDTVTVKQFVYP